MSSHIIGDSIIYTLPHDCSVVTSLSLHYPVLPTPCVKPTVDSIFTFFCVKRKNLSAPAGNESATPKQPPPSAKHPGHEVMFTFTCKPLRLCVFVQQWWSLILTIRPRLALR